MKAVVLLSGGLDSSTTVGIAVKEGYEIFGLTFRYGQKHYFEIEAAKKVARFFQIKEHIILSIDLHKLGGSALTGTDRVPKNDNVNQIQVHIPSTYVPARNTIFLSFALAAAEVKNADTIFIGVNAIDYSGYPDCRPEFIEAFEKMAQLATRAGVEKKQSIRIETPLLNMKKSEIIRTGINLGVDYSITHSCYDPDETGTACGHCDACLLRLKGFQEAGLKDPVRYK